MGGGGPLLADPSASPTSARLTDVKVVDALLNGCPSDSFPARRGRYIAANESCRLHPRKAKPLINSVKERGAKHIRGTAFMDSEREEGIHAILGVINALMPRRTFG